MKGLDFSWARPGGAAIKAAGWDFVVRYVDFPGAGGKGLTADELADYRANGLAIVLVFESTAQRALQGQLAGAGDATTVLVQTNALGVADRPVYFAVDFDAQPDQYAAIDAYLGGAASVLGAERVGVYGSYAVVEHCASVESAKWFWQTYAWSAGKISPHAQMYQFSNGQKLNGGDVDYNSAMGGDFGQWPKPEEVTPAPTPTPTTVPPLLTATELNAALQLRMQLSRIGHTLLARANEADLEIVQEQLDTLAKVGIK